MEQFTHQVGHHPVILPQHPLPYPSTQFYPFKSMFSTFESNSVWCHALPRKWNLNETHAEATGARTVMYSAPQYRFFLFSNQMIMNWKKAGARGCRASPGRRRTTNIGSGEGETDLPMLVLEDDWWSGSCLQEKQPGSKKVAGRTAGEIHTTSYLSFLALVSKGSPPGKKMFSFGHCPKRGGGPCPNFLASFTM